MRARKLTIRDKLLIAGGIIIFIGMFIFLAAPKWLFTKGSLPSEEEAKALKNEVLKYHAQKDENAIPIAIQKLKPLAIKHDQHGVLIIFMKDSYQDYGYYYHLEEYEMPEMRKRYCVQKITDGVYFYYVAW